MKNILIVEDDQSQQMLYKEEFSDLGYEIRLASNGAEALGKVQQLRPDLVIMDIRMPGMSGLETLRKMLNDDPNVPIIINSAYSHYKDDFMSWAAEAYVVKSADLTELKNAVKKVLS
ncbi:MAG: response regulator [Calditrichia bacterium]